MSGSFLRLSDDRAYDNFSGADGESSRPEALHFAPVGAANVRDRMTALAAWIAAARPSCLVVDVSCEIALFVRLLSVPVVLVRLAGRRHDTPHLEAFRAAERLLAPFPAVLEDGETPDWVREKTAYAGFIGGTRPRLQSATVLRRVALVLGGGGSSLTASTIAAIARATPVWDWSVFGAFKMVDDLPANLYLNGWRNDLALQIAESSVVVGGCGDGLLAHVVAQGKRFVCIPEKRPFDEQCSKARYLAQEKMAAVRYEWPAPDDWPLLLDEALALDSNRLASLHNPSAAAHCADLIETVAAARA